MSVDAKYFDEASVICVSTLRLSHLSRDYRAVTTQFSLMEEAPVIVLDGLFVLIIIGSPIYQMCYYVDTWIIAVVKI